MRETDAIVPILLIAGGAIWLLWSLGWVPDLRWVAGWVLIGAGVAVLVVDGFTKKAVIGGPFLATVGLLWFAHLEWRAPLRVLLPVALIALGLLMLAARLPFIPESRRRD